MNESLGRQLLEAVKKKAMGYMTTENVDEYSLIDGELSIVKRKVTKKEIPPDIAAVKFLIDEGSDDYADMTEEELKGEKQRLLDLLRQSELKQNQSDEEKGENYDTNQE